MEIMPGLKSTSKARFITKFIDWSLVIAMVIGAAVLLHDGLTHGWHSKIFDWREGYTAVLVFSVVVLLLNRAINLFVTKNNIVAPQILMVSIVAFSYCALFLGSGLNFYTKFWWWDDLLHAISGLIAGLVGFLLVYYLNARHNMNISPLFVAVFAFTFAVTIGAVWEIIEFMWDWAFKTSTQRWAYTDDMLIGHPWQGTGLRDTISDLIVGAVGGLVAAFFSYSLYKRDRQKALRMMSQTFPKIKPKAEP